MLNDAPPQAKRETWPDWFPDAGDVPQVTIDELVTFIESKLGDAEKVTAETIRYWQKIGVLPAPVKRWHEGATRALYPRPYAFLSIFSILGWQEDGYTLQQIAGLLRRRFRTWDFKDDRPRDRWQEAAMDLASEFADATGSDLKYVQIKFIDQDDEEYKFSYPVGNAQTER